MQSKKSTNFTFWLLNLVIIIIGVAAVVVSGLPQVLLCYSAGIIGIFYGTSKIINFLFTNYRHTIYRYDFSVGVVCILLCVYIMVAPLDIVSYLPHVALLLTAFNFIVKFQNMLDLMRAKSKFFFILFLFSGLLLFLCYLLWQNFVNSIVITTLSLGGYMVANGLINVVTRFFINAAVRSGNKAAAGTSTAGSDGVDIVGVGTAINVSEIRGALGSSDESNFESDGKFDTLEFEVTQALGEENGQSAIVVRPTVAELSGENRNSQPSAEQNDKSVDSDERVIIYSEISEDEVLSQGDAKAPQGEADAPQGEGDTPQGEGEAPQGEVEAPQGEVDVPQGETDAPQGEGEAPQGEADAPQGEVEAPQVEADAPQGEVEVPQGEGEAQQGEGDTPQGEADAPSEKKQPKQKKTKAAQPRKRKKSTDTDKQ